MLAISSRLGPYEIVAPLGAGGMGEVYRARDTRLGREVAIKVLPEPFANDADRRARFEREARAVAALSHPNILAIHDYGSEGGITYAVMELLEGETLRSRLAKGPLPWREAVEIGAAIADGLAAAHAKGIIHRDLKPENLFLTADGRVKILDFGLARIEPTPNIQEETGPYVPTQTGIGVVMGTAGYMSPEQVRGQPVDARCDLFAFGCVLHEMLTGRRAFQRETAAETMAAILHDEPPDATTSGHPVPVELGRILRQCLAKTPNQRLQSARDLAIGLRATASDPSLQRLPTPRQFSWRLVGILAAAILIGTLAASVYLLHRAANRPEVGPEAEEIKAVASLAVLPFVNLSADAGMEYLSAGSTMSLIDTLSQLDPERLRVLSWTAVSRYKGSDLDLQAVGTELRVQAVLIGQVLKQGEEVSIRLELVDTRDKHLLWSISDKRKLTDLQTLHEKITRQVAKRLRPSLTQMQMTQVSKRYPVNSEAYELYLKGRHIWSTSFLAERLQTAIDFFQQAIKKDPDYALAYAGLADVYHRLGGLEHLRPSDVFPLGKEAAIQALKHDPQLADAHGSLGYILFEYEWNWQQAEKELRRALALNPNHANAQHWFSHYSTARGWTEQSLEASRRYRELEPLDITANAHLAWHYYYAGDHLRSVGAANEALVLDPSAVYPRYELVRAYERMGKYERAIAEGEEALKLSKDSSRLAAALAHVYAVAGQKEKARQILADLLAKTKTKYVSAYGIAGIYIGLDDKSQALDWLEKACDEHSTALVYVKADPIFADLRDDTRFANILRRIGLADQSATRDKGVPSVAVLPLVYDGDDPKMEMLSETLPGHIIDNLAQVRRRDLKIRPLSSVTRFKRQRPDNPTIGRSLNVPLIVTGTLQARGDDLTITVEVVEAREDNLLWNKKYVGKLGATLDLDTQDLIVRDVAANLGLRLSREEEQRLSRRRAADPEAYRLYREAMYHFNKFRPEALAGAIKCGKQAIERDPKYALAYAGLARCYILQGAVHLGPRKTFPEARKCVAEALKLDPNQADAHTSLGAIYLFEDWNWKGAEQELSLALRHDPNVMTTRNILGFCLAAQGRLPEALASIRRGQELDPLSAARRNELAMCHNWMRRYDEAIAEAEKALELDRDFPLAYAELGVALVQKGMCEKAIMELKGALDRGHQHPRIKGMLGYAYALAGRKAEAKKILDELKTRAPKQYGVATPIARIYAALGDKDQAFEWLQRACDERDSHIIWLKVEPTFDSLHTDPRFAQVLKDMGLPP